MRAHKAVNIIIMSQLMSETHCKPSLSLVLMYHELSNPINSFVVVCPAASERITGKAVIDSNSHIRAYGAIR